MEDKNLAILHYAPKIKISLPNQYSLDLKFTYIHSR